MRGSRIGFGLLALATAVALGLSGCSGGTDVTTTPTPEVTGGIVTVNAVEPERGLLPADAPASGTAKVVDALWEGLMIDDANGELQLGAAESVTADDQGIWIVKLRPDGVFSDGTPVTAHNFVDAWNYAANVANGQSSQGLFAPIRGFSSTIAVTALEGLTVVDDLTFTVAATADFAERLGNPAFFPLPDSAFADMGAFAAHPIGNGRYALDGATAWVPGSEIRLVKSAAYTGSRHVKNDGITFRIYSSLDAAYTDLLANRLDVLDELPDAALDVVQSDLGDRAITQIGSRITTLTISESVPHFGGEEGALRRLALSKALDRDALTKTLFNGLFSPAKDFTSPIVTGSNANLAGNSALKFSAADAKKLWADANAISPFEGPLHVTTVTTDASAQWVAAMAKQWAQNLGIQAVVKPYASQAALLADQQADTVGGAVLSTWQGAYPNAMSYLAPRYISGAVANLSHYSNTKVDAGLAEASTVADRGERNTLIDQAQQQLFIDLPAIPLWVQGVTGGHSTLVSEVTLGWNSTPVYHQIVKRPAPSPAPAS